jgi:acyl carrier protein
MTTDRQALADTVLDVLQSIAPEVDPASIAPGRALRQQVDLDSMDWLNVLVALNERTGVSIPEADYARLYTLDDLVGYLQARLPAA